MVKNLFIPIGQSTLKAERIPQPCRIWGGKDRGIRPKSGVGTKENWTWVYNRIQENRLASQLICKALKSSV